MRSAELTHGTSSNSTSHRPRPLNQVLDNQLSSLTIQRQQRPQPHGKVSNTDTAFLDVLKAYQDQKKKQILVVLERVGMFAGRTNLPKGL